VRCQTVAGGWRALAAVTAECAITVSVRFTTTCQLHSDKPRPDYKTGGPLGTPRLWRPVLYQLSYGPTND
jgi:hypothetical protein